MALLPGFAVQVGFFGFSYVVNAGILCISACGFEALVLKLRNRRCFVVLKDSSALVTAVLLAIALPPFLPIWMYVLAGFIAVVLGKQLYGGLGFNPFNPAMVAYAFLLVSYPVAMTTSWALPRGMVEPLSLMEAIQLAVSDRGLVDAMTGATPLDVYKHLAGKELSEQIFARPIFGDTLALGWQWVALAYGAGGCFLAFKKLIQWQIPLCVFLGFTLMSLCLGWDPDRHVPLGLHWAAGSLVIGAFFIATDPVSAPTTDLGRRIYGLGIGVLIYMIRHFGSYPDAVAFALLLMNLAAPLLDQFTQPRTFGHKDPKRGLAEPSLSAKDSDLCRQNVKSR